MKREEVAENEFTFRLKSANQPQAAEFLLSTFENGVEWFSKMK